MGVESFIKAAVMNAETGAQIPMGPQKDAFGIVLLFAYEKPETAKKSRRLVYFSDSLPETIRKCRTCSGTGEVSKDEDCCEHCEFRTDCEDCGGNGRDGGMTAGDYDERSDLFLGYAIIFDRNLDVRMAYDSLSQAHTGLMALREMGDAGIAMFKRRRPDKAFAS